MLFLLAFYATSTHFNNFIAIIIYQCVIIDDSRPMSTDKQSLKTTYLATRDQALEVNPFNDLCILSCIIMSSDISMIL